jgi:demethoxyubiquinone hydroxylase (CLK1/Coq7/Cat5 family)
MTAQCGPCLGQTARQERLTKSALRPTAIPPLTRAHRFAIGVGESQKGIRINGLTNFIAEKLAGIRA